MKRLVILILDIHESLSAANESLFQQGIWSERSEFSDASLATVLTGVNLQQHGVLSEWEPRPDGQVMRLAPRRRLKVSPVWERVPGAVAIGMPWSSGSRPDGYVVSADFAMSDIPGISPDLPDRVWPNELRTHLLAARMSPEEVNLSVMSELGFNGGKPSFQFELATFLSLHNIGTQLLSDTLLTLFITRLTLKASPSNPSLANTFLTDVISRYLTMAQAADLMVVSRSQYDGNITFRVVGTEQNLSFCSSYELGRFILNRYLLPPQLPIPLDSDHWHRLSERYRMAGNALPGTTESIRSVIENVVSALDSIKAQ